MGLKTVLSSDSYGIIQAIEKSLTIELSGQGDLPTPSLASTASSNTRALGHFESLLG